MCSFIPGPQFHATEGPRGRFDTFELPGFDFAEFHDSLDVPNRIWVNFRRVCCAWNFGSSNSGAKMKNARLRTTCQVSHFFADLPYHALMRLLLVEDDARIARFVAKGLREQAYAVDVASTGEDALYQAAINTYDLVILDVMIPGRDGFEVCRELRKSGQRMPILMLTARDAVEDRITGLD